ncbi:alpha/beta fold hydrolase [Neorhizobium sp. DAR64861/K0K2]|uniref:alpha/beta fold hydrolase n=1 Tax=unclassified Neorhizobium TaxID=2629175 RepID=UPI003D2A637B
MGIVPLILSLIAFGFGFTAWKAKAIEANLPNDGELTDLGDIRINALHVAAPAEGDLPPIVFIHGASGNLKDQEAAFRRPLEGRAEMLFVDRPGHGYSERGGDENGFPDGQADTIARLMDRYGIDKAIIVGHSFGGAIATSFALYHPEKTAGLLLLAPATHPWPGGVDWYYNLAARPYLGRLFTRFLALPAGLVLMEKATHAVFHPNPRPDRYLDGGATALVLRPENFRNNAIDVANLNDYVTRVAPRYSEITAPTLIINGDSDKIVSMDIHAKALTAAVAGAELVVIRGLGHKPDYLATDLAIAGIEKLAGHHRDLQSVARRVEARLAKVVDEPMPDMDFSIEKT